MKIEKNKVACFHYTLKTPEGTIIETSRDGEPGVYLHGAGNILPSLEKAMAELSEGDQITVALDALDAYGPRNEALVERIAVKHLKSRDRKLQAGSIATINSDKGQRQVTVLKMGKFQATVDGNHPLAGQSIVFDIEITAVRDASGEELAHGHAHGADGHASH
jgi:FKBP-type peptidyl-prolyl cis-trans isomerase SlyD